ncbi:aspergillopepsin-2 heavy chain [Lentinula raphanica]|uniref:Aspergillopepsin-2 heavy chain n=1 Tax=Lentinula raphanica TaxID=153919 RepID=A0AA38PB55_9AGAR|nr:aspergillopepsin-2 heavy chain [Lentinula raphanica]KAJ3839428.1 aspergillopepsin-2 heavy chain [Lentinula raphanica]
MKISAILSSSALMCSVITATWALPSQILSQRASRRHSNPSLRIEGPETASEAANTTIQYSGNWSGAVLVSPPSGETFNNAVGTFTVPAMLTGGSDGAAAAWVGIDGDTYATAILQAGVYFSVSGDSVEYGAWYEWWPNYATDIDTDDFPVSAGDVITVVIEATSNMEGTVTLINESAGKTFSINQTSPTKLSYLGGQNAEWIVEDYTQNGGLVPLANWGTVTFVNASASTSARTTLGLADATIFDIEQYSDIMTSVTIDSDSSVSISYA